METKGARLMVRRAGERGHADHGWLDSWHTFSFADYFDPRYMGFRGLRVINEDRVRPGAGFPTHGHKDMEIISYVLEGAIAHQDSMGHAQTLRPGEVQRMSAGLGVQHSEFNPSADQPLHFYQLWILPGAKGRAPEYEQKAFARQGRLGKLQLLVSPTGAQGSLRINADARLLATELSPGQATSFEVEPGRGAWVQLLRGKAKVAGEALAAGDGAALSSPGPLSLEGLEAAELLVFDLA